MDENLQQVYAELTARCKRIKEGKYIMSGNTIAALLRYITSQPALMACLERCNYGFRYGTELEKAMTGGIFKLPLGSRKVVALVTGLLFELDRGSINFHNFIKQYYRAADVDASFDMFAGSVIMPYLMAFKNALSGEGEEVSAGLDGDDKPVSSGVKEQLMPVILQFTEEIAADNVLTDEAREDFYAMLEGLYYSLELSFSDFKPSCAIIVTAHPISARSKTSSNSLRSFSLASRRSGKSTSGTRLCGA